MNAALPPVQRLRAWTTDLLATPAGFPLFLLILGALVYAPFIPWLGFYWDDQAWIWYMNARGAAGALEIDASFRPLAGWVIRLGYALAGLDPAGWQIFNLGLRWLASVSLWWLMTVIWPGRRTFAAWTAVFFLLYPGFSSHFASVNSSRHVFPAVLLFLSLGLTGLAVQTRQNRVMRTTGALAAAVLAMLTSDYYYGLEFVRGAVIWLAVGRKGKAEGGSTRIGKLFAAWSPYLLATAAFFAWRYTLSRSINYRVSLLEELSAEPASNLIEILADLGQGLIAATTASWIKLFSFPDPELFGPRKLAVWGLVLAAALILNAFVFKAAQEGAREADRGSSAIILALIALLVAGLPFIAANLEIRASFPFDRLLLPYMLGSSMLLFALLDRFLTPGRMLWVGTILVGLAAGRQVIHAAAFQQEWENQAAFFRQLSWRAPQIAPGTALLSEELPFEFSTDNSLTGPLNWVYAPDFSGGELPLIFLNLEIRVGGKIPALEPGIDLQIESYRSPFVGSTDRVLVIYFAPPGCVRVLDPVTHSELPGIGKLLSQALELSRPDELIFDSEPGASLPEEVYPLLPENTWCYYFQRADLARQLGDWETVAALGEVAFRLADAPNEATERLPFIEGYGNTGDWETAYNLTAETFRIDDSAGRLLCAAWKRINGEAPDSPEKSLALERVEELLGCAPDQAGKAVDPDAVSAAD